VPPLAPRFRRSRTTLRVSPSRTCEPRHVSYTRTRERASARARACVCTGVVCQKRETERGRGRGRVGGRGRPEERERCLGRGKRGGRIDIKIVTEFRRAATYPNALDSPLNSPAPSPPPSARPRSLPPPPPTPTAATRNGVPILRPSSGLFPCRDVQLRETFSLARRLPSRPPVVGKEKHRRKPCKAEISSHRGTAFAEERYATAVCGERAPDDDPHAENASSGRSSLDPGRRLINSPRHLAVIPLYVEFMREFSVLQTAVVRMPRTLERVARQKSNIYNVISSSAVPRVSSKLPRDSLL